MGGLLGSLGRTKSRRNHHGPPNEFPSSHDLARARLRSFCGKSFRSERFYRRQNDGRESCHTEREEHYLSLSRPDPSRRRSRGKDHGRVRNVQARQIQFLATEPRRHREKSCLCVFVALWLDPHRLEVRVYSPGFVCYICSLLTPSALWLPPP